VFNNFKTLLKWNHSNYYAGAVGYLAEEICQQAL
jgi:membrane-bound lytic murein transglycosylase B